MPAKNVQHDIVDSNPGRINVMVDVQAEDGKKKVELPLRLLTIGDFTGRESSTPIIEREPINVNKDNFDGVLRSLDVEADYVVTHGSGDNAEDANVHLEINTLSDFHPEAVARQVPKILELVARNLLQHLRNRVINAPGSQRLRRSCVTPTRAQLRPSSIVSWAYSRRRRTHSSIGIDMTTRLLSRRGSPRRAHRRRRRETDPALSRPRPDRHRAPRDRADHARRSAMSNQARNVKARWSRRDSASSSTRWTLGHRSTASTRPCWTR